jgi:superfamily II DNA or RNA helicase
MNIQSAQTVLPPAISSGWFFVPYQAIGDTTAIDLEKKKLTFRPRFAEDGDEPIRVFKDMPSRGYLGMPRAYGMQRFPWLQVDDRRSDGDIIAPPPSMPSPDHHRVKEPEQQRQFMDNMIAAARSEHNFIAKAATGSGKTVVALHTTAHLLRRTIVLVPLERLMEQWIEEIQDKLGLSRDKIGIVQGPTCQWRNRDVVVGMMHSLAQRRYAPEFYRSFGIAFYDETHRVGSQMLAQTCGLFPAKVRIGLSATPDRKDGGSRVPFWHIGPISVTSNAAALECTVYVKRYAAPIERVWGKSPMTRMKALSKDWGRNSMLVDLILRNYRVGRNMLIIGKYIDHLQDLMDGCAVNGVPIEAMGQYTGERIVRTVTWQGNRRVVKVLRREKIKSAEFERIKRESQLIFSTYGMFKEGIDVPRLDTGLDVLPQSDATQVVGRIRRPMEGKPTPYWITILDENCAYSKRYFTNRSREYIQSGCRIVDNGRI